MDAADERRGGPAAGSTATDDPEKQLRTVLARKLALLMPSLSQTEQALACEQVRAALAVLATDVAARARFAVAECLRDIPNAPRTLILHLAHDTAAPVCGPILRLAPLLADTDLLALLATPLHRSSTAAVAGRHGLSAPLADAVAAGTDRAAIRTLLNNHSAAIQEATLDVLIHQAQAQAAWHAPLAQYPVLTPKTARALLVFVAAGLIDDVAQRDDLDPRVAAELRCRIVPRLHPPAASAEAPGRSARDDDLMASLRELDATGALGEATLLQAAQAGDRRRVAAILAVASGLPLAAVDRAAALRNAKALISLAWNAGFTMRAAGVAQTMLAQLGPSAVLTGRPDGIFPLSKDEMQWQIDMLVSQSSQ